MSLRDSTEEAEAFVGLWTSAEGDTAAKAARGVEIQTSFPWGYSFCSSSASHMSLPRTGEGLTCCGHLSVHLMLENTFLGPGKVGLDLF